MFQDVIYVIKKIRNGGLSLHENLSILDMMESHISIKPCKCGSNICNINRNTVQKVGPTMLEYFHKVYEYIINALTFHTWGCLYINGAHTDDT